jgi:quercetin dioxygenase-like cupin family protein
MHFGHLPFTTTDWAAIPATTHPGETGTASWRTIDAGDIRVRMVEYSAGYLADHWCNRGHILLVLEGELITELQDGRKVTLTTGMSYQVANDTAPHRSRTLTGATLFIVD